MLCPCLFQFLALERNGRIPPVPRKSTILAITPMGQRPFPAEAEAEEEEDILSGSKNRGRGDGASDGGGRGEGREASLAESMFITYVDSGLQKTEGGCKRIIRFCA